MALPMLFTACSQDELFESETGSISLPQAKGIKVSMGAALDTPDAETRAIWDATEGKLTWEPQKDLISVFWLGSNEEQASSSKTSGYTGKFNSIFSTSDGSKFTSESMVYVGDNVSVYPADVAHVTAKTIKLSVPAKQDAVTILNTPYISNLLEVRDPETLYDPETSKQVAGYHNELVSPMKLAANVLVLNLHLENTEDLEQFDFKVNSVSLVAEKNVFAEEAVLKVGGEVTNKNQGEVTDKTGPWNSMKVNTINKYMYASAVASTTTLTATDITDNGNGDYQVKFVVLPTDVTGLSGKSVIVVETNCGTLTLASKQTLKNVTTELVSYPAEPEEGAAFEGIVTGGGKSFAIAELFEDIVSHFTAATNATNTQFKGEKIGVPYMRSISGDMANATLNNSKVYSDTDILNYVAIHTAMGSSEPMNLILCDVVDEEGNGDGVFDCLTNEVFSALDKRKSGTTYLATMSLDSSVEKLLLAQRENNAYTYFNNDGQWKNVTNNSLHVVLEATETAWILPVAENRYKIGTMENPKGGKLQINSNSYQASYESVLNNGTVSFAGNKWLVGDKLTNNGTVEVADGQDLRFNVNIEDERIAGTINVAEGAYLTVNEDINMISYATINNNGTVSSVAGHGGLINTGVINVLDNNAITYVQENGDGVINLLSRNNEVKVEGDKGKIAYTYNTATDGGTFERFIEDKFTYVVFNEKGSTIVLDAYGINDISMEIASTVTLRTNSNEIADLWVNEGAELRLLTPADAYDNILYVRDLVNNGNITVGGVIYYSNGWTKGSYSEVRSVGSGAIIEAAKTVSNLAGLQAALANGNNVVVTEPIIIEENTAIDLNGCNISSFASVNDDDITTSGKACVVFYVNDADVTLEITGEGVVKTAATDALYSIPVWVRNGNATIDGGTFISEPDVNGDKSHAVYVMNSSIVKITDGTFIANGEGKNMTLNGKDGNGAKIILSGGNFLEFGETEANAVGNGEVVLLDENYEWSNEADEDGYYTVTGK